MKAGKILPQKSTRGHKDGDAQRRKDAARQAATKRGRNRIKTQRGIHCHKRPQKRAKKTGNFNREILEILEEGNEGKNAGWGAQPPRLWFGAPSRRTHTLPNSTACWLTRGNQGGAAAPAPTSAGKSRNLESEAARRRDAAATHPALEQKDGVGGSVKYLQLIVDR